MVQKTNPANTGGFVSIELFSGEKKDFDDHNYSRVLKLVGELKQEFIRCCFFLNANGVKVVSSDSLLLAQSPEVNFLINFLIFLSDWDHMISRAAVVNYLFQKPDNTGIDIHRIYDEALSPSGFVALPRLEGFEIDPANFRGMSLYDTCEELIRIFGLHLKSPLYMQFLLDEVLKFSTGKNPAISGFLEYWEQKKSKLSVVLPLSPDAVQIMTIHKSKGLEFPVVIYAFADDDISRLTRKSTWVELNDPDLEELEVTLLKIDKKLEKTRYSDIYTTEFSKTKLDLLNLVYVAFTRASERLYVIGVNHPKTRRTEISYWFIVRLS
ncbi:MAG: hypothetical protein IPH20_24270 [Bacteroidales bacterium]|nr:hypothetical protein [Bacteroidales bacterium]